MRPNLLSKTIALALAAVCLSATTLSAAAEDTVDVILAAKTTQAFTAEAVTEDDLQKILAAGLSASSAMNSQPWFFVVVSNRDLMKEISGGMSFGGGMPAGMTPPGDQPTGAPARGSLPEGMPNQGALPEGEAFPGNPPAAPGASGSAKAALGDSPLAIVIYMDERGAMGSPAFDCGLACQNMVIAASALGHGVKIVSSPTISLNGADHDALCEKLGVDNALKAVAVLLIGYVDESVDGVTGATTRSAIEEKVSFVR